MSGIPWKDIIELLKFLGWVLVGTTGIKALSLMLVELFSKTCRHCGKRI